MLYNAPLLVTFVCFLYNPVITGSVNPAVKTVYASSKVSKIDPRRLWYIARINAQIPVNIIPSCEVRMDLFFIMSTLKMVPADNRQESAEEIMTDKNEARTIPARMVGRVLKATGIANAGVVISC